MVSAVRPLGSLSMARGCARIDSRPDTAKIGSADRVEVHHARLLAVIGVRKTFPRSLDPYRKSGLHNATAASHQGLAFKRQVSSFTVLLRRAQRLPLMPQSNPEM
jgi:hypothetical protein